MNSSQHELAVAAPLWRGVEIARRGDRAPWLHHL